MPLVSPVVFPLHPIVPALSPDTAATCGCGDPTCTRVGRHPAVRWAELAEGVKVPRPVPGAGAGLKTGARPLGSGVIVVDVDRPDVELPGALPATYAVATGRGLHLYFQHPGFRVGNSVGQLAPGVDIRGDGGFVVAPGSPHRSGATYTVVQDVDIAEAPAWLLDWLRAQPARAVSAASTVGDETDPDELAHRRLTYRDYLASAAPSIAGQGGDAALWRVVQHGAYDLALPVDDVLAAVREVYDPRCVPPWGDALEERVRHKANDAKQASARPRAEPIPVDVADHLACLRVEHNSLAPAPGAAAADLPIRWGAWDAPLPILPYLLTGMIPQGKVVVFFAEGGSVKTWTVLSLAMCVATGAPWLGQYPVLPGKALILDFEDGPHEVQRRAQLLAGAPVPLPDLGYWYCTRQVDDPQLWADLVPLGLTLLVIDSLGAGMPGDADENTTAFSQALKLAGRFTEATGCTVVFVHHANKTGGMRGSSAIRDQADVAFRFEPVSETDNVKRMRMICDKPGPQRRPPPVNVELSDRGLHPFEDEAAALGRNAEDPTDVGAAILLALANGPMATKEVVQHAIQARGERVRVQLAALVSEGKVVHLKGRGGYQLDDDSKRRSRVVAALATGDLFATYTALSRAAHVEPEFLATMARRGEIALSAEGKVLLSGNVGKV